MASNRIKGLTIEIGGDTTKLDKALAGTDRQLRATQASLKDVERLLKLDPGNVELLSQKQRLLTDAVDETKERLQTLETAAEQAYQQLSQGQISQQQFDALNRELIETKMRLDEAAQAADDFDIGQAIADAKNALDGLGGAASGAAGDLSRLDGAAGGADGNVNGLGGAASGAAGDVSGLGSAAGGASGDVRGLGDAAGDASGGLNDLSGASGGLSGGLDGLSGIAGGVAIAIGQKLVEALVDAAEWMWNLDEATEEYREAMGKLNTSFEVAGFSTEAAKEAYEEFYKILGDTDTATEASQLLAQLVDDEQDISKWTEIAAGVYGTFGDALPIEGLIEAANETAKTGKVTGVLADALNWVGMSEEEFNDALAKTSDEGKRAQLIMNNLGIAYEDAAGSFKKNNETLIESRESQMQMDEAMAGLGETVSGLKNKLSDLFGPMMVESINGAKGAIEWIIPFFEMLENEGIGEKLGETLKQIFEIVGDIGEAFSVVFGPGIELAIKGIGLGLDGVLWILRGIAEILDWLGEKIQSVIGFSQDLFGVSKQASNISVGGAASSRGRAVETPYSLRMATAENLPYLAQGTVTRPNSPFMAVVGDNPNEPEIVSPLSTIEQAVRNVVGAGGGRPSNMRVTVNFTGSAAQLVRMLQPMITVETDRRGPQLAT